jgi:hypothetical protein
MLELHWDEAVYAEETASLRALSADGGVFFIGSDFSDPARTVSALIEARRNGVTAALYPLLADPLERVVEQVAAAVASQNDAAARHTQLLALRDNRLNVNQKPLGEAAQYDAATLRAATLAAKLADVLLFFTAAEKERWSALLGKPVRRFAYLPVVPFQQPPQRDAGVVVYAPGASQSQLALVAIALADRRIPASVVCTDNPGAKIDGATVIVPSWWRPGRVAAFAAAGYRVAAPSAGAPDDRCVCATYRPTDALALTAAVDAAQAVGGLRFDVAPADVSAAIGRMRVPRGNGPRVSVVVRTFDRPVLLARALRSIAAQTYGDVEIVVVNNGGADVRDVVEANCGGRPVQYERLPERKHISAASNAGARAATGTYIAYLDDDDLLYPDHVARAVDALERTASDLAYTNCVAEYARMDGGVKHLLGFQIFRDAEFVPKDLYVDNFAPIHSIVHRRDLFERFGYFDEELAVTDDWEMWLRASRGARFVHVDRVTCEYSWRLDPSKGNMTLTHQRHFAASYEKITQRYAADVAGIAEITAMQDRVKAAQQQRAQQVTQFGDRLPELTIASMAQQAVAAVPAPRDPFA